LPEPITASRWQRSPAKIDVAVAVIDDEDTNRAHENQHDE
jgi:hypothetical protein